MHEERKGKMGKIKVTGCEIEGVKVIEPEMFGDERGWFMEAWHKEYYAHSYRITVRTQGRACFAGFISKGNIPRTSC